MNSTPALRPTALPIVAILGAGILALSAGAVAGGDAVAAGAAVFVVATLIAFGQTAWPIVTWPNALLVFIAVLWFVPIKLYRLPVDLPFQLELYRILIVVLVVSFVVGSITTKRPIEAFGASKPLFVLAAVALTSQIVNSRALDVQGGEDQALKSLSLLLSLIIVFLLFASALDTFRQIEAIAAALVIGGVIVAIAALYEGRTQYNVFDHLASWFPLFERNEREVLELRGGRLRVHASAQHPIAFGAALTMLLPFVMYFAAQAKTRTARFWWVAGMILIVGGAAATISRTTIAMGITMAIVALSVRRQAVVRLLPLLLVLPLFVHAVAPGAIGGLLKSINPEEGLVNSLNDRAGEAGSGRFADFDPAMDLWSQSPLVGLGLDNPNISTSGAAVAPPVPGQAAVVPLIFDNQYLHTFVSLGLLGLIAIAWFVWGTARRLLRSAKRMVGPHGDFLAACGVACAGYGASMFFYDSLAFIQVTLLLFIFAALGLKTLALAEGTVTAPETRTQFPGLSLWDFGSAANWRIGSTEHKRPGIRSWRTRRRRG